MVLRGQIVNGLFHGKGAFEYFNGMAQLFNSVNSLANNVYYDDDLYHDHKQAEILLTLVYCGFNPLTPKPA